MSPGVWPMSSPLALPTHPVYQTWAPTWVKLRDLVDGSGGFLAADKPYLIAHPREYDDHTVTVDGKPTPNPRPRLPSQKLTERRTLARYENLAGALLRVIQSALFRQLPTRKLRGEAIPESHPWAQWRDNVDGTGSHLDYWLADQWLAAGTFGHVVWLLDRPAGQPALTAADVPPLFVRSYTPLDLLDWLEDDLGNLTAVRLQEAELRESFDVSPVGVRVQVRDVTRETWTLRQSQGGVIGPEPHQFGVLPVTFLFARRRALTPHQGQSVLDDPSLFIDQYNLISEERELLRKQTFGLLNVPLGAGEGGSNVEREKALIGTAIGTAGVLFTSLEAKYISPDASNVTVYQEHRQKLERMIYRLLGVPYETDTRDAESAESRRIKREELGQVLAGYADELERAEYALWQLWYRGTYGDRWLQKWAADEPTVKWPDEFSQDTLDQVIEQAMGLLGLDLPPRAAQTVKTMVLKAALPDLAPSEWRAIEQALEDQATAPVAPAADAFAALLDRDEPAAVGARDGDD